MKATLRFDLENVDDQKAHMRAIKSLDLVLALYHINEVLRKMDKETPSESTRLAHSMFLDTMDHYGINLDEMLS